MAVILGHKTVSGDPDPSEDDKLLMWRLSDALRPIDVQAADYFIVAGNAAYLMADLGWVNFRPDEYPHPALWSLSSKPTPYSPWAGVGVSI